MEQFFIAKAASGAAFLLKERVGEFEKPSGNFYYYEKGVITPFSLIALQL